MAVPDPIQPRPAPRAAPVSRPEALEEHLASLRAFVRLRLGRRLRTKEESQDLVQSVCREVLSDPGGLGSASGTRFRAGLLLTAERKIRDRWRRWRREKRDLARERALEATNSGITRVDPALVDWVSPSRRASGREALAHLERAYLGLPGDYREVIVLARLRGWSHARIAAHMGRTVVATRTLLSRALARLAFGLDEC